MHDQITQAASDAGRTPPVAAGTAQPAAASARLVFLDALRGIAAMTVLIAHALEHVRPDITADLFQYINIGQAGVVLFFLCSGFIIPVSIERQGSLRVFWMRRFWRLYPAYWVNILIAIAVQFGLGLPMFFAGALQTPLVPMVAANLTMVASLFGVQPLLGPYWTLQVEMQFYVLVSILFVLRFLRRSAALAALSLIVALLVQTLLSLRGPFPSGNNFLLYIGMMFVGSVLYRLHSGELPGRAAGAVCALAALTLGGVALLDGDPSQAAARLAALAVFLAGFAARRAHIPPLLRWLGLVSYSIYLMHSIALATIPPLGNAFVTMLAEIGATLLMAWALYGLVERPAIAIGRRMTAE